jgi:multiple sugar transport system permease protein
MVIAYSFFDNVIMNKNPVFVGLANYGTILRDPVFHEAIRNTLLFTVISVFFHMALGLFFAMLLNTNMVHRVIRATFRVIFILPWVFTAAIVAILWRLMMNPNGVINYLLSVSGLIKAPIEWLGTRKTALLAVSYINIWAGYPFYMMSLLAGLQGISEDLYEAATVDGANAVHRFFSITIPQLKPIIVSMGMLDFIWSSQQFSMVWMTTGGGPVHATEMISTYTYKQAFQTYTFSLASTSAVIILLSSVCLAAIYVYNQKARD